MTGERMKQRRATSQLRKFHLSFTERKGLGRDMEAWGERRDRGGRLSGLQ